MSQPRRVRGTSHDQRIWTVIIEDEYLGSDANLEKLPTHFRTSFLR
jgi:hypothetical protein